MLSCFFKNRIAFMIATCVLILSLQSCGGAKDLMIPYSVSTAGVTTVKDLDLKEGQYEVLKTMRESASVVCEYKGNQLTIKSGDGDFSYKFVFDAKSGWSLNSFSGAASFGYFTEDYDPKDLKIPVPEEFARRVAMSRIISSAADYGADGIIEPITVTSVSSLDKRTVEYTSTVRAKLISIKTTK